MAEQIDSLMVSLGLEADKQSFDNGVSMFNGLRGAALGLAGVLGAAAGSVSLASSFASSRQELGNFARQMQVSAQDVRGLEFAFEQMGGEAGEARSAIESMVRFQDALRRGDSGAFDAMSMLGLDPRAIVEAQDAQQAIERVMQAMQGMDDQQRRIILQDMGINSPAAFRLFGQGAQALDEYMARAADLAPVTQDQIDMAHEFNQSVGELKQAFDGLAAQVSTALLPQLTGLTKWTKDFLVNNNDDIAEFISEGPEAFGRKYGEAARERLVEWWNDTFGSTEIRRGQGQEPQTLNEALQNRQGPPMPSGEIKLRRGQGVGGVPGMDSILEALAIVESGGKHRDEYGALTQSPTGALGKYQILPSTGRDPGFGIQPLAGHAEQEHERFARDYMEALLDMFGGNLEHAITAYNAGMGNVQRWTKDGQDWMEGARQDLISGSDRQRFAARQALDYIPKFERELNNVTGNPQASVSQSVTIQIDGAGDPRMVAMEVDRRLREHSERAADNFRSSVV